MQSMSELSQQLLHNQQTAEEYAKLDLPFQIARDVIYLRQKKGLTQAELAQFLGTQQSSISRLEKMGSVPTLNFLSRVAEALDAKIEIRLVSKS